MAVFNITTNMTQATGIINLANEMTGGLLGLGILLIVSFGTLFMTSIFSMKESLISTTFIAFVTALFLKYLDLLGDIPVIVTLIAFLLSMIFGSIKSSASP